MQPKDNEGNIEVTFYYFEGCVGSTAPFGHVACAIRDKTDGRSHYFSIAEDGLRGGEKGEILEQKEEELIESINHEIGAFRTPFIKKTVLKPVSRSFDNLLAEIKAATDNNRSTKVSPIKNNCAHYVDTVLATIYADDDIGYESAIKGKKPTALLLPITVANNVYRKFNSKPEKVPYMDFIKGRFNSVIRSIEKNLRCDLYIMSELPNEEYFNRLKNKPNAVYIVVDEEIYAIENNKLNSLAGGDWIREITDRYRKPENNKPVWIQLTPKERELVTRNTGHAKHLGKANIDDSLRDRIVTAQLKFEAMVSVISEHKQDQHKDKSAQIDQSLTDSFVQLKESVDAVISKAKELYPVKYYLYGLVSIFCKDPVLEYCKKFKQTVALAQKESLFNTHTENSKLTVDKKSNKTVVESDLVDNDQRKSMRV